MEPTHTFPILVTNLDINITEKQLSDFFSFCGKITSLTLRKKEDSVEGVLYFEHQSSAKTALLLSNALINDKPMHVQEYTEEKIEVHGQEDTQAKEKIEQGVEPEVIISEMPEEHITHREGSERTATATIASILASGYIFTVDALAKAKHFDDEKHITDTLNQTTSTMKERATAIDQQYGISEKASNTSKQIGEQWNQIDTQYNISQNTATVTTAVSNTVSEWGNKAATGISTTLQTPAVQNTLSSVSSWTNRVGASIGAFLQPAADTVTREFNDIKEKTTEDIEVLKKERDIQPLGDIQMEELGDFTDDVNVIESSSAPVPSSVPSPVTEVSPVTEETEVVEQEQTPAV